MFRFWKSCEVCLYKNINPPKSNVAVKEARLVWMCFFYDCLLWDCYELIEIMHDPDRHMDLTGREQEGMDHAVIE